MGDVRNACRGKIGNVAKKKNKNNIDWPEVKRIVKLSVEEVEMAKKCGMSPRTVRANYSSTFQEKWKGSTREWIRDCYERKFGAVKPPKTVAPPPPPPEPAPPKPTPVYAAVAGKRSAKRVAQQRLALAGWEQHIANVLRFPFDATVQDCPDLSQLCDRETVRVTGLTDPDELDDTHGIIAIVQTARGEDNVPLYELRAADPFDENDDLLRDYADWFANR